MIISGTLCQNIVPLLHDVAQLHTIFLFCGSDTKYEQWAKNWSKIKSVFTEMSPICEVLKQAVQQCEQNAISVSFVSTSGDAFNKNLDQLDSSFMHTQIMKEILITIQFEEKHIKEFIDHYHVALAEDEHALKNFDKFQKEYHDKTSI
jgi:hypothetical protein